MQVFFHELIVNAVLHVFHDRYSASTGKGDVAAHAC